LVAQVRAFASMDTGYPDKTIITTTNDFGRMIGFMRTSPVVVFDFETSGVAWFKHACACGIALGGYDPYTLDVRYFYVPFRHHTGEEQLNYETISPHVKELLEDESKLKIAHNIKFDEHMARRDKWEVKGPRYDTMIAAHLYDENRRIALKVRAVSDLGCEEATAFEARIGLEVERLAKLNGMNISDYRYQYGYSEVNIQSCGTYACFDVEFTFLLYLFYEREGISKKYSRIWNTEMKLTHILCDMERNGIPIDVPYLQKLRGELEVAKKDLTFEIEHRLGRKLGDFNLASDDHMREYLIKQCRLTLTKTTKKGKFAVDREVLESFAEVYPVLTFMQKWREVEKLLSTYTTSILDRLDKNNVLHPDYQQVGTNCLPAGELVLTNRGYIPVEQVQFGDLVLGHSGKACKVLRAWPNGKAKIYKVTLGNGLVLRASENHPFLCNGEWVEAWKLEKGKKVTVHSGKEIWRKINNWPLFSISSWGRVRNDATGRVIKQRIKNESGHLKVCLYRYGAQTRKEGNRKDKSVHRLMAQAFLGIPDFDGAEIRHLSGHGWENVIENLRWGTSLENSKDAIKHGTMCRRNGSKAKLTEKAVKKIRETPFVRGKARLNRLGSDRELAAEFGVSRELIRDVRLGKRWLPEEYEGKRAWFYESRIVSVERDGYEVVYGLTVEGDHSHVTSGMLTHNSGRLSCKEPNFQNQPTDNDARAKEYSGCGLEDGGIDPWSIRRAYVVGKQGWVRLFFDYSQVELRITAFYTQDPVMVQAFLASEDIHDRTSIEVFGSTEKVHRRKAKVINFGLVYSMSPMGFSRQTGVPLNEAEQHFMVFFKRYAGITEFKNKFRAYVYQNKGYFENLFGRPKRILNTRSFVAKEKSRAERQEIAVLIQGTAAELTKESFVRIHDAFDALRLEAQFVATVHDEIQIDCPIEEITQVVPLVKNLMEDFKEFHPIPIIVDCEYTTTSWADKKGLPDE